MKEGNVTEAYIKNEQQPSNMEGTFLPDDVLQLFLENL